MNRRKFFKFLGKVAIASGGAVIVGLPDSPEEDLYPEASEFDVSVVEAQSDDGYYDFVSFDKDGVTIQWTNKFTSP